MSLQEDLMVTQLDLYRKQARWETWKAVATFLAAAAVFGGAAVGLANWLHPAAPRPQEVHVVIEGALPRAP